MTVDPGRLEQITAKFVTSGRCNVESCRKRVKRTKSFTARSLTDLVDQAANYNRSKGFLCKKHKPALPKSQHVVMFDRSEDEVLTVWLDGQELANANHDEHGWAGIGAVEDTMRRTARQLGWKVVES